MNINNIKVQLRPFFRRNTSPAESKTLRLRKSASEMQLSHSAWGSPLENPPTVFTKTVSSLLRGRTKTIVYVT